MLTTLIAPIHQTKTDICACTVVSGQILLRDGVQRLINAASSTNVQLAIASTSSLVNIQTLLRTTLGPYSLQRFAVIGAGDQVQRKNPCRKSTVCAARTGAFPPGMRG